MAGGAVAATVGQLLQTLGARRQVLCVTHLPQVAAFADAPYRVTKAGPRALLVGEPIGQYNALSPEGADGQTVKAKELSGSNNLLFRRNSVSGAVEVVKRDGTGITLNEALHAN